MTNKTETLHHPTLPSTVEVDTKDVESWTEAGWRKSEPKVVAEKVDATSPN